MLRMFVPDFSLENEFRLKYLQEARILFFSLLLYMLVFFFWGGGARGKGRGLDLFQFNLRRKLKNNNSNENCRHVYISIYTPIAQLNKTNELLCFILHMVRGLNLFSII